MISKEAIAEMADLFDRFVNALDPNSPDAQRAEDLFNAKLYSMHSTHAPDVEFRAFRYELLSECRKYLSKN